MRAVGLEARRCGWPASIGAARYNLLFRQIELETLRFCAEEGVGVIS